MNIASPRGSKWRKWDLQVHTPNSKLGGNQYKVKKGENPWTSFVEEIKKSDVKVFGITDYYSIENYKKLLVLAKTDKELNKKVFFPNIEFRLDISVNSSHEQLQCHLIFDNDPKLITEIEEFLNRLPLVNKKANDKTCYCTEPDISACGGYDKVSVSLKELKIELTKAFGSKKPYLLAGVVNGMGSFRATANSNIKKELADLFDKECDIFFGKEDNVDWLINEDRYENKDVKALPKAVVATSDAHSFADIKESLGKQLITQDGKIAKDITWIKANRSFEGLRQIVCEPTERVRIGITKPDMKKSYFSIDKVRIIDNTGENNFIPEYIKINPNLTSIVGGKSTGKSLLLYYMAKTIDPDEVDSRIDDVNQQPYDFDENQNFDFEVLWSDGHLSKLKSIDSSESNRKILYIPQNYLNKLSEKNVKSRTTLNNFVMNVLLQDENIKNIYSTYKDEVKSLLRDIPTDITLLYQIKADASNIVEQIKKIGDEKGIKKYIKELETQLNQIKQKSQLTKSEINDYEKLREKEIEVTKFMTLYSSDRKRILDFVRESDTLLSQIEHKRSAAIQGLSTPEAKTILSKELSLLDTFKPSLSSKLKKVDKLIGDKIIHLNKDLVSTQKLLAPFNSKFKFQAELKKVNNQIKEEQSKLDILSLLNKDLKDKRELFLNQKQTIIKLYIQIFKKYENLQSEFKKYDSKFEDISLNVSIGFKENYFNESVIGDCLNKSDIKRQLKIAGNTEYQYSFDQSNHLEFIENLFEGIINKEINTVRNASGKEAIIKLMDDYFGIDFRISYKNDSLDKMSPGKKGLVLLRLLINLSNEEWPIMLDQPEDDLDNRSIYDDLVEFIKNKKRNRQIIIVTHNPNLVVGADAEEIIVANQEGQELGRDNKKFRFEYVSGALENTFENKKEKFILHKKGIREHVCEILEGGEEAFKKREQKYRFD